MSKMARIEKKMRIFYPDHPAHPVIFFIFKSLLVSPSVGKNHIHNMLSVMYAFRIS